MNIEMGDKAGELSKDTSEALWKNPETRRIVGEQIKEATQGMAENIKELEDVMRLTIQALAQKKPESEDKNEKQ